MNAMLRPAIARLHAYVPGEQPEGEDIVKLNTNENPYPPAPGVAAALRAFDPETLRRYPDPSCRRLREKIAAVHEVRPDQVIVGNGSDEILALCVRAFVPRGGRLGYFEPSYSLYPVLAAIEELDVAPLPLPEDGGTWIPPADYRADLFLLTHPNAPTGALLPQSGVEALGAALPAGVLAVDEAYADFARENAMKLARTRPNVLAARTLSKSFSLAGLRLGYAVGPTPLIAALHKIRDSYNVDRLAQELAWAALDDLPHMRRNVARIVATRARVATELTRRGFRVPPSETNFLWIRPPAGGADAAAWFDRLRKRLVFVRHFPGPRTGDRLRVTIGTDREMDRFLAAVDDAAGDA